MNTEPDASEPTANSAADTNADVARLESELAAQKDRHLRLAAEFDNYRKRAALEGERRAAAQKEAFIRELLPVIDNLERALASDASGKDLREGVQLALQQLHQLLRGHSVEPDESVGLQFDPHRHEALRVAHDASQPDHAILDVFERGYRRDNEIFRPAKVIINDLSQSEGAGNAG